MPVFCLTLNFHYARINLMERYIVTYLQYKSIGGGYLKFMKFALNF